MSIYERNVVGISKRNAELIDILKQKIKYESKYQIYVSDNNYYTLLLNTEDKRVIHVTSPYNPIKQAEKMLENLDLSRNKGTIIFIGVGLGYHINEVLKKIHEGQKVIVVESDIELLKEVLNINDFSEALCNDKIFFVCGNLKQIKSQLQNIMRKLAFHIVYNQLVTFEINSDNYRKMVDDIREYVRDYSDTYYFSIGNDIDDTLLGMKNRFDNINRVIKSTGVNEMLEKFRDVYKNKPAFIVASGPSLDKNIKELKKAVGKSLILSCDGSLSALLKEDIIPNAVGSVERIYKTYEAFYKDKKIPKDIVCTCPAIVRKEIFDSFDNKILSFFKNETLAEWMDEALAYKKGLVWSGASVSHMLFGLANKFGCNPIVLVGQDLAYSEEGISHVNSAEVKEKINLETAQTYVKGKNGNMLPSTYVWKKFLVIYNEAIRTVDNTVIDATEGGALIEGTKIEPLKDTINKYCHENVVSLRRLVDSINIDNKYIEDSKKQIIKRINEEIFEFEELNKRVKNEILKNAECFNILNGGIENQEELDYIYDSIEGIEENIVRYIFKSPRLTMFFQYLIFRCAYVISNLEEKTYTLDSIFENVKAQKDMLEDILKYGEKAVKVYYYGIRRISEE
ncbi:MAG: 6-hydroxymethylpterin diphosphokinase MptE-like protein [Clostridium butyricum]|nr:6-hydroxymethylpterin diphosphokinase MptE-like protein [Clostridium butyricum]